MKNLLSLSHSLRNFVVCAEGNVSSKQEAGFIIKASGAWLENLTEKDVVFCNFDGSYDSSSKKPSMEVGMHVWLYENFDCNVIAHTHPKNTLQILCSAALEEFSAIRLFPDHVVFNGQRSCIVPYANPGLELKDALEKATNKFVKETNQTPNVFLLQNHGIIIIGKTHTECQIATEICEKAAEVFIGSKFLNGITKLSEKDIDYINKDKNEIYRKTLL